MKYLLDEEVSEMTDEQIKFLLSRLRKEQKLRKEGSRGNKDTKTIDWVEMEYGDAYEKEKKCESGKQSISSTIIKHLNKSEIESLRQNKRDAYALMMKMD